MGLFSLVKNRLAKQGYLTQHSVSVLLATIKTCLWPLNIIPNYSVLFLLLVGASHSVTANELSPEDYDFRTGEKKPYISWLPGERYYPRTGRMGHTIVDMEVKGNRLLPIVIKRTSYTQGQNQGHFGNMNLHLPRIGTTEDSASLRAGCPRVLESGYNRRGVIFGDGDRTIEFVPVGDRSADAPPVPADAVFVSTSNWIIKCNGRSYMVLSPDGMRYKLGSPDIVNPRSSAVYEERMRVIWNITAMYDPYGNALSYRYDHGTDHTFDNDGRISNIPDKVTSITGSDGREVIFHYSRLTDTFGEGEVLPVATRVRQIVSKTPDGSPPQYVSYGYAGGSVRSNRLTTVVYGGGDRRLSYGYGYVYQNIGGSLVGSTVLDRVVYPEGAAVNYKFSDLKLTKRTTEDAGVTVGEWNFYQKGIAGSGRDFARIINGPYNTTEYRYRPFARTRGRLNTSDGKLLMFKNFGRKLSPDEWHQDAKAHTSTSYEYQWLYKITGSGYPTTGTVRREIKSEITIIDEDPEDNGNPGESLPVDFKRFYDWQRDSSFHGYYRLRKLTETSTFLSRTTDYTYWNLPLENERWINGKVSTATMSGNDVISYGYNEYGDVNLESNNGVNTHYTYNRQGAAGAGKGELASTRNEEGSSQMFLLYKRGIAGYTRNPAGRQKNRTVNDNGTLQSEQAWGSTHRWVYEYDDAQRLKSISYPGGIRQPTTIYWPDVQTKIETATGEGGVHSTTTKYDGFGQVVFTGTKTTVTTAPLPRTYWRSKEYAYDSLGRLTFESHPSSHPPEDMGNRYKFPGTDYTYDALNRLKSEHTRIGSRDDWWDHRYRKWEYISKATAYLGIKHTDGRGSSSTSFFQDYGSPGYKNRVEYTDANGITTYFQRDPAGRLLKIRRNWQERKYIYNGKKQLESETHPENGYTGYTYNINGLLERAVNQDRQILYRYYQDDQLRQQEFVDGTGRNLLRIFEYDQHGNLASLKNRSPDDLQNNDLSYAYDTEGRVLAERMVVDGRHYTIDYKYDTRGNLSSRTFPNGRRYEYAPNGFGEPTKIMGTDGKVIYSGISYHAGGPFSDVSRRSPNQNDNNHNYRIAQHVDVASRSTNRRSSVYSGFGTLAQYDYNYDKEANLVDFTNQLTGAAQTMTYDRSNRLKTVEGAQNWSFRYNANDDITRMQQGDQVMNYNYDTANSSKLRSITSSNPERQFNYDSRGNVIKADIPVGGSSGAQVVKRTMTRNAANQLVAIDNGSRYAYDARGLRVSKDRNGKIYTFYDHEGMLRFRDDVATGVTSEYFYVKGELLAKRDTDTGSVIASGGTGGTAGPDQPNGPTGFKGQAFSGTAAQFNWTATSDSDHGGTPRYELYRNGSLVTTTGTSPGYWLDTGLTKETSYQFELVALYPDGTRSARVGPITLKMVYGEVAP